MDTRQTVTELLRRVAVGEPQRIAELYAEAVLLGEFRNTAKPTDHHVAAFALDLTVENGLITRHDWRRHSRPELRAISQIQRMIGALATGRALGH